MDGVPTVLVLLLMGALARSCSSLHCEAPGRYADATNCRSFLSCEVGPTGQLMANALSCNSSEVFNPSLSECVPRDNFICLQEDAFNNTDTNSVSGQRLSIDNYVCIWPGIKFPDYSSMNCSNYFVCVYQNWRIRKVLQSCPTNKVFDIGKNTCIDSTLSKCRRPDWGEPDKIMYKYKDAVHNINITVTTVKNETNCRDSGRFFNSEEPDCRNYMSCERNANGSFTKQLGVCPNRYIFDPFLSICVEERYFQCQVNTINNANLHEYYGGYAEYKRWRSLRHKCGSRQKCKKVGIYPDYSVPGCRGFQLCLQTNQFSYKSVSQICPHGYVFNVAKSMCTMNENVSCPCNMQHDYENTTIEIGHHHTSPQPEEATESNLSNSNTSISETKACPKTIERCLVEGFFPNYNERGCKSFILCAKLNETSFTMLYIYCPVNYVFDANDSQCKPNNSYTCPCPSKLFPTEGTTVENNYTTPEFISTTVVDNVTSTSTVAYESTLVANTSCYKPYLDTLCTTTGFMPDYSVTNCNGYKLCLISENGTYSENKFICPTNSVFDSTHNMCLPLEKYKCACKEYKITNDHIALPPGPSAQLQTPQTQKLCPINDCLTTGLFPEYFIPDCRGYKSCQKFDTKILTVIRYMCPFRTIFNTNTSTCVESNRFNCSCTQNLENIPMLEVTTSPTETTSSLDHITEQVFINTSNKSDNVVDSTTPPFTVTTAVGHHTMNSTTVPEDITTTATTTHLSNNINTTVDSSSSIAPTETSTHSGVIIGVTDIQQTIVKCPMSLETCTAVGRFPDYSANDCSKFYLCILLNDGAYSMLNMTCPGTNLFNGNLSQCVNSTTYKCPCVTSVKVDVDTVTEANYSNISSTEIISTIEVNIAHTESSVANTEVIETTEISTLNVTETITDHSTNNHTNIGQTESSTISSTASPSNITAISDSTFSTVPMEINTYSGITDIQQTIVKCPISLETCTAVGRFPDYSANDCSKFYLCVLLNDGAYSMLNMTCPGTNLFNAILSQCVNSTTYECPCVTSVKVDVDTVTEANYSNISSTEVISTTEVNIAHTEASVANTEVIETTEISTLNVTDTITDHSTNNHTNIGHTESSVMSSTASPSNITAISNSSFSTVPMETSTHSGITDIQQTIVKCPISLETCTAVGRFPDYSANDCSKFYLCVLLNDGAYSMLNMTCPGTNLFNGNLSQCVNSTTYECPCVTSVKVDVDTVTEANYSNISSTEVISTTEVNIAHTEASVANTEVIETTEISTLNVTDTITDHSTNNHTNIGHTESSVMSSTASPSNITAISNSSFSTVPMETSTHSGITDIQQTIVKCPISLETCTAVGRFPDYSANDCSKFYLCVLLNDGAYSMLNMTCPGTNLFNANLSQCVNSTTYECPCVTSVKVDVDTVTEANYSNISSTEIISTTEVNIAHTESSVANTEVIETTEITTLNVTTTITDHSTNNHTNIGQTESSTISSTASPSNITAISDSTFSTVPMEINTYSGITDIQQTIVKCPISLETCTAVGRFPDYSANDCSKFYLCVLLNDGAYSMLNMTCPGTNLFNAILSQCVNSTTYECPCVTSVKVDVETVTEANYSNISSTEIISTTEVNIAHTDASAANSEPTASVYTESYTSDKLILCPESITSCPAVGNYPDYSSNDCRQFFHCAAVNVGTISMLNKTCPMGQSFNVNTSTCVASISYECPCVVSSINGQSVSNNNGTGSGVELNVTTTLPLDVTTQSSISESNTSTFNSTNNFDVATTTSVPLNVCPELTCSEVGRLADYSVSGCGGYKLCISSGQPLEAGFRVLKLSCPFPNIYDPFKSICVEPQKYQCECA